MSLAPSLQQPCARRHCRVVPATLCLDARADADAETALAQNLFVRLAQYGRRLPAMPCCRLSAPVFCLDSIMNATVADVRRGGEHQVWLKTSGADSDLGLVVPGFSSDACCRAMTGATVQDRAAGAMAGAVLALTPPAFAAAASWLPFEDSVAVTATGNLFERRGWRFTLLWLREPQPNRLAGHAGRWRANVRASCRVFGWWH
jgi:hypothetical protein